MTKPSRPQSKKQKSLQSETDDSKPKHKVKLNHDDCPRQKLIIKHVPVIQPQGVLRILNVTSISPLEENHHITKSSPVVLLPFKTFNFLGLPGEIRNKIYTLIFASDIFQIRYLTKQHKTLSYQSSYKKYTQGPYVWPRTKLAVSTEIRRREFDRNRWIKCMDRRPEYHIAPGPTALLHVCKAVNEETTSLFYARNWFVFGDPWTLRTFVKSMRASTQAAVRNIQLTHQTHGESRYTRHRIFKKRYDRHWSSWCSELSHTLCNLERLSIRIDIKDNPCFLNLEAEWALPLLTFARHNLRDVNVKLSSIFQSEQELQDCAEVLRREMLGAEYREDEDETTRLRSLLPRGLQLVPARRYVPA